MVGLVAVSGGAIGGFIGWWVGLMLCPDWGDLGIGALPWCMGGAISGAAIGAFAGAQIAS